MSFARQVIAAIACFVASALATKFAPIAASQDKAPNPLIADTLKGVENRAKQLDPVYVKYKVTRVETPAWVGATEAKGKKGGASGTAEKTVVLEAEYARKENKQWSFARQVSPLDLPEWERESFWLYNGELAVRQSNRPNEYLLSKKPTLRLMAPTPENLTHEARLVALLREVVSGSPSAVVNATEEAKGGETRRLLRVEFPKTKWTNKVALLPKREYSITRYEVYNAKGGPVDIVEVERIEDINGIAFPMTLTQKHYLGGGELGYRVQLEVSHVALDEPGVPDSLFQFEFPPDSQLFDEDLGVVVRKTEIAESHLKDVVDRLAPPPPLWRRWWAILLMVAGAILLAGLIVRWRMRSRPTQPAA